MTEITCAYHDDELLCKDANADLLATLATLLSSMGCGCCADYDHSNHVENAQCVLMHNGYIYDEVELKWRKA